MILSSKNVENNIFKIGKSPIKGKGIFTEKDINKNEIFYIVPIKKLFSCPIDKCAKIAENKWLCDENVLSLVNHSCDPNTKLDISKQQPLLTALRDISNGEEITVDYDSTEIGGEKVFCECKKPNCKGYFLRVN